MLLSVISTILKQKKGNSSDVVRNVKSFCVNKQLCINKYSNCLSNTNLFFSIFVTIAKISIL